MLSKCLCADTVTVVVVVWLLWWEDLALLEANMAGLLTLYFDLLSLLNERSNSTYFIELLGLLRVS